MTNPILAVFVANAMLAVVATSSSLELWHLDGVLPGYWYNPTLAGDPASGRPRGVKLRPGAAERALASRPSGIEVAVVLKNHTHQTIHLIALDAEGHRDPHWIRDSAEPGLIALDRALSGQAFVVVGDAGDALCSFVLGEEDALVDVDGPC